MADDIDIEEHHLSHDAELGIFHEYPDLELVKTEVIDIEDGFGDPMPSTSTVIPDSTTDVDYQPPRTTESPHIISSTSAPPEEYILGDLDSDHQIGKDKNDISLTVDKNNVNDIDVNVSIVDTDRSNVNDSVTEATVSSEESYNEKCVHVTVTDIDGAVNNENDIDSENDDDTKNFYGNCIIIGTKSLNIDKNQYYEDPKCFNSFVELEDWGPYLRDSNCYCMECEILYPNVNALDYHKMQMHSFLVAVPGFEENFTSDDVPSTIETTNTTCTVCHSKLASRKGLKKHMLLVHNAKTAPLRNSIIVGSKKDANSKVEGSSKGVNNVCFVCQEQCASDDDLINHLYNFHTFRCDVCDTVFAKKEQYDIHMLTHNTELHVTKTVVKKPEVKNTENEVKPVGDKCKLDKRRGVPRLDLMSNKVLLCPLCPAQFHHLSKVKRHYKFTHKNTLKKEVTTQKYNPKCPICNLVFMNRCYFNKHIRKHNRKQFTAYLNNLKSGKVKNDNPILPSPLKLPANASTQSNIKCELCSLTFVDSEAAEKHKALKHSQTHRAVIFIKKTALYKCPNCDVHFNSWAKANSHWESSCIKFRQAENCKICCSNVNIDDILSHVKKHSNTPVKMTQCLKCKVYFVESDLADHAALCGSGGIKSIPYKCVECKIYIDMNAKSIHDEYHKIVLNPEKIMSKKDAKQIYNNEDLAKNNSKHPNLNGNQSILKQMLMPDKIKLIEKSTKDIHKLIHCKKCDTYSSFALDLSLHCSGACKLLNKVICEHCGIYFPLKAHKDDHADVHKQNPNLTLQNIIFFNDDFQLIRPSVPKLFKCPKCKVHFDRKLYHSCDNVEKSQCDLCNIDIVSKYYQRHMDYHNYKIINFPGLDFADLENTDAAEVKSESDDESDDISAKIPLWQCEKCGISSHNSVIVQKHNFCTRKGAKECKICNLRMPKSSKAVHEQYHAKNPNLTKKSFNIIPFKTQFINNASRLCTYNNTMVFYQCFVCKLVTSKRENVFRHIVCRKDMKYYNCTICNFNLTVFEKTKHIEFHESNPNITKNDIFVQEFKPKVPVKNSVATLAKPQAKTDVTSKRSRIVVVKWCTKCKKHFHGQPEFKHNIEICDRNKDRNTVRCCGLNISRKTLRRHKMYHSTNSVKNIFKIEAFTPYSKVKNNVTELIIFKCEICNLCTEETEHECKEVFKKKHCRHCNLLFDDKNYDAHQLNHLGGNVKLNIRVIPIEEDDIPVILKKRKLDSLHTEDEPKSKIIKHEAAKTKLIKKQELETVSVHSNDTDNGEDSGKIFKCPCGLHFVKMQGAMVHQNHCDFEPTTAAVACSQCDLLFTRSQLVIHMKRHHGANPPNFEVVPFMQKNKKPQIYKCEDCNIYFVSKVKYSYHLEVCGEAESVVCDVCNINISKADFKEHRSIHIAEHFQTIECFNVISSTNRKNREKDTDNNEDRILYRCSKCQIHFVNLDGLNQHVPCEQAVRRQTSCPECGLKFYASTIYTHITVQHTKNQFEIDDLVIKESDNLDGSINTLLREKPGANDVLEKTKVPLYECGSCNVMFPSTVSIVNHHKPENHVDVDYYQCEICQLKIHFNAKDLHIKRHHGVLKCDTKDDYKIYRYYPRNLSYIERSQIEDCDKRSTPTSKILEAEGPNVVYKCPKCNICFLVEGSYKKHLSKHGEVRNKMACDKCGLRFGPWTLHKHIELHHTLNDYKIEDLFIKTCDFKREMFRIDGITDSPLNDGEKEASRQIKMEIEENDHESDNNKTTDENITDTSINDDQEINNENKTEKTSEPNNDIMKSTNTSPSRLDDKRIKLYRCKQCNVNYLKQNLCYRHALHHKPLSEYDFIQCKVCTLNFPLQSLANHMAQHKKREFTIDDILIEEYEPVPKANLNSKKAIPKIDIYLAVERDSNNTPVQTLNKDNNKLRLDGVSKPGEGLSTSNSNDSSGTIIDNSNIKSQTNQDTNSDSSIDTNSLLESNKNQNDPQNLDNDNSNNLGIENTEVVTEISKVGKNKSQIEGSSSDKLTVVINEINIGLDDAKNSKKDTENTNSNKHNSLNSKTVNTNDNISKNLDLDIHDTESKFDNNKLDLDVNFTKNATEAAEIANSDVKNVNMDIKSPGIDSNSTKDAIKDNISVLSMDIDTDCVNNSSIISES